MIVYLLTNTVNGKHYIGQTIKSLSWRFGQHRRDSRSTRRTYLCNAIRKHGIDSFKSSILERCTSLEDLNSAEKKWISYFKSTDRRFGYNTCDGGKVNRMTSELIAKAADKRRGRRASDETRKKMSLAHKGKPQTWNRKLSDKDVSEIRLLDLPFKDIATKFKVDPSVVSRIKNNLVRK